MHVVINHLIHDSMKWEQGERRIMSMIEQERLPKGLKALQYLPGVDKRRAVCLWETNSLDTLREFVDRETGQAAHNDYFEVRVAEAVNLPGAETVPLAKAA